MNFAKLAGIATMLERVKLKDINIPDLAESCGADMFWNMPVEKMDDDRNTAAIFRDVYDPGLSPLALSPRGVSDSTDNPSTKHS